jgi:2-polyprenyl-6-methoxyphenol hydroxylase-like FAD-dependent oxidoreductase
MMAINYDAIVVGARCAGSPTAMLLARRGYRVLLVDRASFPSDTLSTLLIQPAGTAALRRWGLLDDVVASGCPPIEHYAFDPGPFTLTGQPRPHDGNRTAYAPRRTVLDKILVDAAAQAGVEVRERFTVEDILVEDGVVVGIRGHGEGGRSVTERARVVIGADGRNSRVAKAVRPDQYKDTPVLANAFYTFWSGLPVDGVHIRLREDRGIASMPTNDGLTLVLVGFPAAQAPAFKADVESSYLRSIDRVPELAERLRDATREERFAGGGVPNFIRKPFGPGWALVGDAGYTKDPITAQGISDAFGDAELCATALDETFSGGRSFEEAMSGFHQTRDAHALPMFDVTTHMASFEPPPPEMQQLLAAVLGNQDGMDAFLSVIAGTALPADFVEFAQRLVGTTEAA